MENNLPCWKIFYVENIIHRKCFPSKIFSKYKLFSTNKRTINSILLLDDSTSILRKYQCNVNKYEDSNKE